MKQLQLLFKLVIIASLLTPFILLLGCDSKDIIIIPNKSVDLNIGVLSGYSGAVPYWNVDTNKLTMETDFNYNENTNTLFLDNLRTDANAYIGNYLGVRNSSPAQAVDIGYGNLRFTVVDAPTPAQITAMTLTAGTAGNLTGNYTYIITYTTTTGETSHSGVKQINGVSSQKVNIANLPISTNPMVTGRKIYRGTAGQTQIFRLVGTVSDNTTTTFEDNVADGSLGALVPDNSTGGFLYIGTSKLMSINPTNFAFGIGAGGTNNTGEVNTWIGNGSGASITSGVENVGIGSSALNLLTTGNQNMALGYASGANLLSGGANTLVGRVSGNRLTTGTGNAYIGHNAGFWNSTGSSNSCIGQSCLFGASGNANAQNTAIGNSAGFSITTGSNNLWLGYTAGYYETSKNQSLYFDSVFRNSRSLARIQAPFFGAIASTPATQYITTNANRFTVADYTSLGTEKLTNGTFTGGTTGWTLGAAWLYGTDNVNRVAGGGVTTLTQTSAAMATPLVVGELYQLSYVVSATSGTSTMVVSVGGNTFDSIAVANSTFYENFVASSNNTLTFTPAGTGTFTIDSISLKKILGGNITAGGNLKLQGQAIIDANVGIGTTTPQNTFNVVGDGNITTNIYQDGNFFGNQIWGDMNANNINKTVTVASADVYYQIGSDLNSAGTNGFVFQNGRELKALVAGKYLVNWNTSVTTSGANDEIESATMINGVAVSQGGSSHCTTQNANKPCNNASSGVLTLAVNDLVSLGVLNHSAATNIAVNHANLTLVRVGN